MSSSSNSGQSPLTKFATYLCWALLAVIVLLVILTVFNMDLFMSYFDDIGSSKSFGAFLARFWDYVVAVFAHTFSGFGGAAGGTL